MSSGQAQGRVLELEEGRLSGLVLGLAWPVVIDQTALSLVGVVNAILVGQLGKAAMAGVGISWQIVWLPQVVFMAVSVGATAIVARHVGARQFGDAKAALHQAILLGAVFGLASAVILWVFAADAMRLLRAKSDAIPYGVDYIRAFSVSMAPTLVAYAANSVLRGSGDTRTPMAIVIVINAVNLAGSLLLINGYGGTPRLGATGAGIAASIAQCTGGVLALTVLAMRRGAIRWHPRQAFSSFSGGMVLRILRVGTPAGLEQLLFQIAYSVFSAMIFTLGTDVYAAHTVAMRVENIAFMPGFAFGIAAMALVGQGLGQQRPGLAERAAYTAQKYAIFLMTMVGAIMFVAGRWITRAFIADAEVIGLGALALRVFAFSMPAMGTSNTLAGALRGAGDTRGVMLIMASCVWGIRLPLALLLIYVFHAGATGAWTAAVVDINVRAALIWWRFAGGRWKTARV